MARRPSGRKITRRDAVVLIGAGAMVGAAQAEGAGIVGQQGDPCYQPADVTEINRTGPAPHKRMLFVDGCCQATRNAILVGVEHPKEKFKEGTKKHLMKLEQRLDQDTLAEYVYMVWGLSATELSMIRERIPKLLADTENKVKK